MDDVNQIATALFKRTRQKNPTFSTKRKKYGGGNLKNESKDGFFLAGRSAGLLALGVGAELVGAHFSRYLLNRFELSCRKPPLKKPQRCWGFFSGDLTENRTPIARMKTWCPNR